MNLPAKGRDLRGINPYRQVCSFSSVLEVIEERLFVAI
jgi:hypothetical protein